MAPPGLHTLPDSNIHTLAPRKDLDFFDRQSVQLSRPVAPLEAWSIIMARPMPVLQLAFTVRDAVSSLFGVKRIGGFSHAPPGAIAKGEKLDFFLVEHAADDVLSLSERDVHLDVLTCIARAGNEVTIVSSVQTHTAFRRAYMLPVAPAHKIIVRTFLRRLKAEVG